MHISRDDYILLVRFQLDRERKEIRRSLDDIRDVRLSSRTTS